MALASRLAATTLILLSLCGSDIARGSSSHRQLKTYPLPNNPSSADISLDEELVITASWKPNDDADAAKKPFVSLVQIWKFKEQKLVAEFAEHSDSSRQTQIVRFAPDGNTVLALLDRSIHVLRATDLSEISSIALDYPSDLECEHEKPSLEAMELSPNGGIAAVLWVSPRQQGRIKLYDLASGQGIVSWNTPQGWIGPRGFAWDPDGKSLVIAIPNETPCYSPSTQPDVFAFNAKTGAITEAFTTGLLTGSVAVSPDHRVLAVDLNCLGVFKNRDPKLRVFDLTTGKHLRDISGPAGVRYIASASADGSRFLAFTGKMGIIFDLFDAAVYDNVVNEKFTVWNMTTYEEIATSQNIPGPKDSDIRLSPKGKYAVSSGTASFVYELP
jgi:WD40 repeat protein